MPLVKAEKIDISSDQGLNQGISILHVLLADFVKILSIPHDLDLFHRPSHRRTGLHALFSIENYFGETDAENTLNDWEVRTGST